MTKLISIGTRGTAFVQLDDAQIAAVKLNENNAVDAFAKTHRTNEQLKARERGEHQGVLWADSASWLSCRGEKFWLGSLAQAQKLGLVKHATIVVRGKGKTEEKLSGFVRADFDAEQSIGKAHRIIAVETTLGRIESATVKRESGKGNRNTLFVRDIISIDCAAAVKKARKTKAVKASAEVTETAVSETVEA